MNEHDVRPLPSDEWERLLSDIEDGEEVWIQNGGDTVAVLIGIDRYDELITALNNFHPEATS